MSGPVVAGIDIGNSTTEVVLARLGPGGIEIVGAARTATRGAKGSSSSLDGAAALVARMQRTYGVRAERAAVSLLRPVATLTAALPEPRTSTGRMRMVSAGSRTAAGHGFGAGRPHRLNLPPPTGTDPVVAVAPAGMGYRAVVEALQKLRATAHLVAVALADDEAVLVSNRLGAAVPVVDEVDAEALLAADLVAIEVAAPGSSLRTLTDAVKLIAALGLDPDERADAARLALHLADCSNAAIAVHPRSCSTKPSQTQSAPVSGGPTEHERGFVRTTGRRVLFPAAHRLVVDGAVGLATGYALPPDGAECAVDDLWTVDLAAIADAVLARRAVTGSRAMGLATLRSDAPLTDPSAALAERLGIPVVAGSESRAAWRGGCSTAAAGSGDQAAAADGTVVIDIGGGTVDVVTGHHAVVAAGAGELLTRSAAALAGTTAAVAEWMKRGAAQRVEAPQVLLGEDGSRSFLDRPAPAETIGSLVTQGPAGLLPFSRTLSPGEWRALRLRLKVETLGANVTRALRTLDATPQTVIVVGGPAGDDEVLAAIARALPEGVAIGRGDVAGRLGHRYAVAYGLLALPGPP